jgi:AraC family transcriptional regulator
LDYASIQRGSVEHTKQASQAWLHYTNPLSFKNRVIMQPGIKILPEMKMVGKRVSMTLSDDKTKQLWQSFMPKRKEIQNSVGRQLYSMQVYRKLFDFNSFDAETLFDRWAAVEVTDFDHVPDGLEPFLMKGGLYAVFLHRGTPADVYPTFHYIFNTWLPHADYLLDNRPHFEILTEKYRPDDPNAEEEIWIPIREKDV